MKSPRLLTLLMAGNLLLAGLPAMADEIIIIHRSGKIQTVQIDSAADPVEQVSFRRKALETPAPQSQPQALLPAPAAPAAILPLPAAPKPDVPLPAKAPDKPGVKIKWAEPMDAKY